MLPFPTERQGDNDNNEGRMKQCLFLLIGFQGLLKAPGRMKTMLLFQRMGSVMKF